MHAVMCTADLELPSSAEEFRLQDGLAAIDYSMSFLLGMLNDACRTTRAQCSKSFRMTQFCILLGRLLIERVMAQYTAGSSLQRRHYEEEPNYLGQ